jgi:hypothetical protein
MHEISLYADLLINLKDDDDLKEIFQTTSSHEITSKLLKSISGGRSETTPDGHHTKSFIKTPFGSYK